MIDDQKSRMVDRCAGQSSSAMARGEDRAELFVPAHLGVEAVDQKANAVIGQRGAI